MTQPAIRVENLGKQYQIGAQEKGYGTFREAIMGLAAAPLRRFRRLAGRNHDHETFWALRDVSFDVQPGEVVGIIGRNGAGKSTLLKILTQITEPTEGRATIRGRVGSLLEVGTGFHPELTGRENVFLNGAILGMSRVEIKSKFDEIVAFSGVEKFLDTPVKRYSSGMKVRLAFAVAAHLDPEILLIDEVLAVGDAEFQKKCLGKMHDVAEGGRTILFVSHNMAAVQSLCQRIALLEEGQLARLGPCEEVLAAYLSGFTVQNEKDLRSQTDREGTGQVRFTGLSVCSGGLEGVETVRCGSEVSLRLDYFCEAPVSSPVFYVGIYDAFGVQLLNLNTRAQGHVLRTLQGEGSVSCIIPRFPLPPSSYRLNIAVMSDGVLLDRIEGVRTVHVEAGDFFGSGNISAAACGKVLVKHSWMS